jgi:hypothetical protein
MKSYKEAWIESQGSKKGRSFGATCLTLVEADTLWDGGSVVTDDVRPVLATFVGTDNEIRPFVANLMTGRKAVISGNSGYRKNSRLEFLRSAGYATSFQREAEGTLATVYLADLFRLDPGLVDPMGAKFIIMPTIEWAKRQNIADVKGIVKHVRGLLSAQHKNEESLSEEALTALVPTAFLFTAFLDRRTRSPILQDGRFYLQLLVAFLSHDLASFSVADHYYGERGFGESKTMSFSIRDGEELGYTKGVAFNAHHDEIETILAEQVDLFFKKVKR